MFNSSSGRDVTVYKPYKPTRIPYRRPPTLQGQPNGSGPALNGRRLSWSCGCEAGTGSATLSDVQQTTRNQHESSPAPVPERQFRVQLSSTRRGARLARLLATEQLRSWGMLTETAPLVVAELANNAALHGRLPGRDFCLTLTATETCVRIEVSDARAEALLAAAPTGSGGRVPEESGRGLMLVEALADQWGVIEGPEPCKTVWAEVGSAL